MTRTPSRPLVAALLLALLGGAGATAAPAAAEPASPYLVSVQSGATGALAADLRARGVAVTRRLDGVGVLAVRATAAQAVALQGDPRVAGVSADRAVALQSLSTPALGPAGSLQALTTDIGARAAWAVGATGSGVDVAVLDTGVTPVPGLDGRGKLLHGPDLSFDAPAPALRHLDGFGHGTHMAGIIAGRDASFRGPGDTTSFAGVAPGARVVSVKVADAYGNADVSQIIAGIDWVVQHQRDPGLAIRVLNLSVGLPSQQGYRTDPLAHAAEQAWLHGLVVVASAGNEAGPGGGLLSPAYDPYVLAVGATQDGGRLGAADDSVASYSNRGTVSRTPDLVAPGQSVASLRVPGSWLDRQYPGAVADGRYFRGSGTSQAAAVVSGAAALLLQRTPGLTPDQVKAVLTRSAVPLSGTSVLAQGKGRVQAVVGSSPVVYSATQSWPRSTGGGSLDAARGGYRVRVAGALLTGETDVWGRTYASAQRAALESAGRGWTGGSWNGSTVTGAGWAADGTWATVDWTRPEWSAWVAAVRDSSGGMVWDGRSWAGGAWSGRSWAGRSWATGSWS